MLDAFTKLRLGKILAEFHTAHGRDISHRELISAGIDEGVLSIALKEKLIAKYQVKVQSGAVENRYRASKDWRSLNKR